MGGRAESLSPDLDEEAGRRNVWDRKKRAPPTFREVTSMSFDAEKGCGVTMVQVPPNAHCRRP